MMIFSQPKGKTGGSQGDPYSTWKSRTCLFLRGASHSYSTWHCHVPVLPAPGNPGIASFYEVPPHIINTHYEQNCTDLEREKNAHHSILQEFMLVLQKELSDEALSIWAVSHIGAFVSCICILSSNHIICLQLQSYMVHCIFPITHRMWFVSSVVILCKRPRAEEPSLSAN